VLTFTQIINRLNAHEMSHRYMFAMSFNMQQQHLSMKCVLLHTTLSTNYVTCC